MTSQITSQLESLNGLFKVGTKQAAKKLNELVDVEINLTVPEISIMESSDIETDVNWKTTDLFVVLSFEGALSGAGILQFSSASSIELVQALTGENIHSATFEEVKKETISEIGNILVNSVVGTFANALGKLVKYQLPKYIDGNLSKSIVEDLYPNQSLIGLLTQTRFDTKNLEVEGEITLYFQPDSLEKIIKTLETGKVVPQV